MARRGDLSPDDKHIWTVVTDTVAPKKRAKALRVAEAGPVGEPVPRSGAGAEASPAKGCNRDGLASAPVNPLAAAALHPYDRGAGR